ncbi:MAG TPA: heme exporter protein CcmD [Dongiaceae bacterium]|jgi:heme exporter protein D
MSSLSDFLAMGGYAGFVWPAYAIAAAVLIGVLAVSWRQLRQARELLRRYDPEADAGRS